MLKGCQREMIVLHTTDSPLFEDAFFVLRPEKMRSAHGDMMAEANRIIAGGNGYFARRRAGRGKWLYFAAGVLLGAGIFFLARLLFGV